MANSARNDFGTAFRRRFPRRPLTTSVGVLSRGEYTINPSVEIGEGGLLLEIKKELVMGTDVVVSFFLPKRDFISVTGEVVYSVPGSQTAGVRFKNLSFESKRLIRDYIAEITSEQTGKQI